MASIKANYAVMATGQEGLTATWGRIEGHLRELDAKVAATGDMKAEALTAYTLLKMRWTSAAEDRQQVLGRLAAALGDARAHYGQVDRSLAAQFGH